MATAPNLTQAALQAFANMYPLYLANTLKGRLTAFASGLLPTFVEQTPNDRPQANWLTLISAVADQMPASQVPYVQLDVAVSYVYKLCFMTNLSVNEGLIFGPQGTAVLTAYNAHF